MNIKHLEYALEIYHLKSFTKAAKRLHLTQPSLSQYILTLEHNLGFEIFNRSTKPLSLTHLGEIFINSAEEIMETYDGFRSQIEAFKGNNKLRIGVSQAGRNFMIKAIKLLYEELPNVNIEFIEERTSAGLVKLVEDGLVDFCIMSMPSISGNIDFDIIYEENLKLLAHKDSPIAQKYKGKNKKISLSELENERFIMPKDTYLTRYMIDELFKKSNFTPKFKTETSSMDMIVSLVACNVGVCFGMPYWVKEQDKNKISIFKLEDPTLSRLLILGYAKGKKFSKISLKFLSIVRKLIKEV